MTCVLGCCKQRGVLSTKFELSTIIAMAVALYRTFLCIEDRVDIYYNRTLNFTTEEDDCSGQ